MFFYFVVFVCVKECFLFDLEGLLLAKGQQNVGSPDTGFRVVAHHGSLTDSKPATGGEVFFTALRLC